MILSRVGEEDDSSNDDNAPPDIQDHFGSDDEEVIPVGAKPFLFGNMD